jgi:hypothetical protein
MRLSWLASWATSRASAARPVRLAGGVWGKEGWFGGLFLNPGGADRELLAEINSEGLAKGDVPGAPRATKRGTAVWGEFGRGDRPGRRTAASRVWSLWRACWRFSRIGPSRGHHPGFETVPATGDEPPSKVSKDFPLMARLAVRVGGGGPPRRWPAEMDGIRHNEEARSSDFWRIDGPDCLGF